MTSAAAGFVRSLGEALPRGRSLPDDVWRRRHRALLALLALHPFLLALVALVQGFELAHALTEAGVVAVIALAAAGVTRRGSSRKLSAGLVSFGLITSSAILVHVSGGVIEAHFHFFVMLSALVLYEDWFPYLLALAYVVVHHGAVGTLDPTSVYNHPGAWEEPWKWAAIHAVFVSAASSANIAAWRLNEDVRAETRSAYREARTNADELRKGQILLTEAEELAELGSWEWDVRANHMTWSPQLYRILGVEAAEFEPSHERFVEIVHPDDRALVDAAVRQAVATRGPYECEFRLLENGGEIRTVHAKGKVIVDDEGVPLRMVGAAQDVTNRKQTEEERERLLAKAREQVERLRELDRLNDVLISSVSHDLRTPLTSIRGYLELLREAEAGELADDQAQGFLEVVDRNAERLLRIVSDLLFVSQLDAGLVLERGAVDLGELARESVEAARPHAHAKGIELRLEYEAVPAVDGDRARLAQLLDNLVSNALKFTPRGGRVDVRTHAATGNALLHVSDTGIGIAADDLARLFERFFRTRAATEGAIAGTGLGLSITKAIVEAHGGTIRVKSTEGVGTAFTVALPIGANAPVLPAELKREARVSGAR